MGEWPDAVDRQLPHRLAPLVVPGSVLLPGRRQPPGLWWGTPSSYELCSGRRDGRTTRWFPVVRDNHEVAVDLHLNE
jgi:hypothetical protein